MTDTGSAVIQSEKPAVESDEEGVVGIVVHAFITPFQSPHAACSLAHASSTCPGEAGTTAWVP
jgi:hypothetical protein